MMASAVSTVSVSSDVSALQQSPLVGVGSHLELGHSIVSTYTVQCVMDIHIVLIHPITVVHAPISHSPGLLPFVSFQNCTVALLRSFITCFYMVISIFWSLDRDWRHTRPNYVPQLNGVKWSCSLFNWRKSRDEKEISFENDLFPGECTPLWSFKSNRGYIEGTKEERIIRRTNKREQKANIFAPDTLKRVDLYMPSKHSREEMIQSQDKSVDPVAVRLEVRHSVSVRISKAHAVFWLKNHQWDSNHSTRSLLWMSVCVTAV